MNVKIPLEGLGAWWVSGALRGFRGGLSHQVEGSGDGWAAPLKSLLASITGC